MKDSPNSPAPQPQFPAVIHGDIGGASMQTVNARDLQAFLEVGRDFPSWFKERIGQYGFAQDHDYRVFPKTGENPLYGGRPTIEYQISLDMAKKLAMVERNERGKQVRQYFIAMERRARAQPAAAALRRMLLALDDS
jgi:anti-repressor protein